MADRVARIALKSRDSGRLDLAEEAFRRGEYETARAYLVDGDRTSPADRSRALLLEALVARTDRDDERVVEICGSLANDEAFTPMMRAIGSMLLSSAKRHLGDAISADRLRETARRTFRDERGRGDAMLGYLLGHDAWERADYDEAEARVESFTSSLDCLALRGWIEIKRERFRKAGTFFGAALALDDTNGLFGLAGYAAALGGAATVAAETIDLRLGRRVKKAFGEITWPATLAVSRLTSLICLRWLALLEGDLEGAYLYARQASQLTLAPAFSAQADLDAAASSRLADDEFGCAVLLREAWRKIRSVKWGDADDDQRNALLDFAAEAAREMPAEARQAVMLFRSLRAKRAPHLVLDGDRRVEALAFLAGARVDEARGERAAAIEGYTEAYDLYREMSLPLRIAIVGTDLYRLTRNDAMTEDVREALSRASNAWIWPDPSPADSLGPKAREILARLLMGQSAKTVAAELDRSTYTVTNHTRRIFEVFGVHSRDDLREKCAELDITPASLRLR